MRDVDDPNDNSVVEDLVDHPEFAPPGRVSTLQLVAKRLSAAVRISASGPRMNSQHATATASGRRSVSAFFAAFVNPI